MMLKRPLLTYSKTNIVTLSYIYIPRYPLTIIDSILNTHTLCAVHENRLGYRKNKKNVVLLNNATVLSVFIVTALLLLCVAIFLLCLCQSARSSLALALFVLCDVPR